VAACPSGGDQIYGYATIGTTIALFCSCPLRGMDRWSFRKKMLLAASSSDGGAWQAAFAFSQARGNVAAHRQLFAA
jgi:hypothetical protein